jgi:hypothetical protein
MDKDSSSLLTLQILSTIIILYLVTEKKYIFT